MLAVSYKALPLFRISVCKHKRDPLLCSGAFTAPPQDGDELKVKVSLQLGRSLCSARATRRDIYQLIIMGLILKILIYLGVCSGVQSVHRMSWLPCQFTDERVFRNNENHTETELIHREAMLQFGQTGDAPVNPHAITFLVTGSKLDLRRYVEEVEPEQLECELRRYSTEGIHVRWPVQAAKDYNRWFICTIKHTKGLFTATSFLRHPSDQPPSGQQDYHSWSAIADREILSTTAVMVVKTQSPSVKVGLGAQQKLHCQFAVDHKGPDVTVEWHWQNRGERLRLFSHTSRSGQTQGSGVGLKSLAGGDASYALPFAKMSSEGLYVCSVSVTPLFASLDISLHIEEAPRVSLNVGPTLSLQQGEEQKVVCEAADYYPLDVEIVWYEQDPAASGQRVGASLPKVLQNVLLSSHRHNQDKTYSLSAFFYLQASLRDSGRQFTCSVHHQSLRVPIRKSFILTVEEPSSWMFTLTVGFIMVILLIILFVMLRLLHSARKQSVKNKPY
ncbi:tapasin-related protein [Chelmon rostratus]|uniref:tapasin-related protein n=1 Tax=Chelmon rostratus TaxID=109905 RepID=UPI001BEB2782|nr:tapasin-related protein [Chelmon rostratus]